MGPRVAICCERYLLQYHLWLLAPLQSSYLPPGASYQPSLPKPVPLEVLRRFAEERANARANRGAGAERVNAVQADS